MTGFDTDRLADLLALTDTDRWRARPGDQARYITEMIDRVGETVTTEVSVIVAADLAAWAAHCGVTTVEEAERLFRDVVDVDTVADCLGRLDQLPDSVTVEARPADPIAVRAPAPESIEAAPPEPIESSASAAEPDVVAPLPAGEDAALEAAARVLFEGFSPGPDWTAVTESLRRRYRGQAGDIVAAYLAVRPNPEL